MLAPDRTRRADSTAPPISWWVIVGAAVLAVLSVAWQIRALPFDDPFYGLFQNGTDLRVYQAGGRVVLDGIPLYRHSVLWGLDFTYPPFAALIMTPLALVATGTAMAIWWSVTFAALFAAIMLSFRSLGYRVDARLLVLSALAAVAATSLEPVRTTIWLGQINIILMLLVLVDLVLLDTLRPGSRLQKLRLGGIGVGIAAGIKLTPAFFVVYLLALRRWRSALTAAVAFVVTVAIAFVIVPSDSWRYWTVDAAGASTRIGRVDSPANQSVNGFICQLLAYFDIRRFAHPGPGGPVFTAPWWLWMPIALIAAGLGLWAAVVAHRLGRQLLSVTIAGMTASAVSPFSWGHHWVWFVPLLVVAFDQAYRSRSRWWWAAPAAIVALSFNYWYNWWNSGPRWTADHAIALGLFMMPRWPDPQWFDYPLVLLYAGCYPLVLLLTIVVTLVGAARTRRSTATTDAVSVTTA
ncbi:glycosyltransferase 87 family protein [Gordonia bronchialis]|uniref:glycosyltransferase 87 family protein n=1 Tax=Gordonia bronchialis TaxID=2054 RepID=UPI001CC0CB17|nr:glycosyltransferase 87 family protein [Gordonia bronchialis]UAK38925.1 glycosyltransferase 87 family protein [Gordonia bronchialis]